MRVNAIFLRISIYVPRLLWLGVKFIINWTFKLSEQVVISKIWQKLLYFSCDRACPYNILSLEQCLKQQQVNVHLCQAWWVKNICIHCKNTLNATLGLDSCSYLIINVTDVDKDRWLLSITCSLCLVTVMVGSMLGFPGAGCNLLIMFLSNCESIVVTDLGNSIHCLLHILC